MSQINNNIFYFFYNFANQSNALDRLIVFVAETLPYFVIILAVVFVLFNYDISTFLLKPGFDKFKKAILDLKLKWREMVLIFLSSILAWFLATVLKNVFMEPRPFLGLPDVSPLWFETGYAFPSGHSATFMALAFAIYLNHKKTGCLFIIFAILIGFARITAGVHFPIDILGGFMLGILVAYFVRFLYQKIN